MHISFHRGATEFWFSQDEEMRVVTAGSVGTYPSKDTAAAMGLHQELAWDLCQHCLLHQQPVLVGDLELLPKASMGPHPHFCIPVRAVCQCCILSQCLQGHYCVLKRKTQLHLHL